MPESHIEIRHLQKGDERVLDNVDEDVFDNAIVPEIAREFLADPRHHIVVALDGETVVGMASAFDYIHPDKPVELFVNEVGVASQYRRQGIGKQLMAAILDVGRQLGCKEAWLGTEYDNHAARALYECNADETEDFVMYSFKIAPTNEKAEGE